MESRELGKIAHREIECIRLEDETNEDEANKYRCHEVARALASRLRSFGINAVVKDGVAVYDLPSLIKVYWMGYLEKFYPELKEELLAKKKKKFFHSWCEIKKSPEGVIIIDCQWNFSLNKNVS